MINKGQMIKEYKIEEIVQEISHNCKLYRCSKSNENFFMYQYKQMNECDQYNFKVIKKLIVCTNVPGVIQRFQHNQRTYFITDYISSNLLKQQLKQPNQIFQLQKSLTLFAQIIQIIEELHQNNVIYRNLRIQTICYQKNQLYLKDFTISQIVRRKQRYFQTVGLHYYLAPEFFCEDGYGYEADIWAAGVVLYFMITGEYPFNLKDKSEQQMLNQINKKCKKGFDFISHATETKKAKYIQSSKALEDLFKRIFEIDYLQRISIKEMKKHPALKQYFKNNNTVSGNNELTQILEQSLEIQVSIMASQLTQYPCCFEFHKQQVILDFLQHSSEIFMLEACQLITQKMRAEVNFSILKVGVMKAKKMIDIMYGMRQNDYNIQPKMWEQIRKLPAFGMLKRKIQKKAKILEMLFRAAFINMQNSNQQKSQYFSSKIPKDFSQIKHQYRIKLSKMFDLQKQIMKKKLSKKSVRKNCQNLARLTILWMINRIFQQQNYKQNFELYFKWSKKQTLQDIDQWIHNQKMSNLKIFIKTITSKYME